MLPSGGDPTTAKLAVELLLSDIDDLLDSLYTKDNLPEGDERTIFEAMRRDLHQELQTLESKILTFRIIKEECDNHATFARLLAEEKQAARDHELALRLSGMTVTSTDDEQWSDREPSLCSESEVDMDDAWNRLKEFCEPEPVEDLAGRQPLHGLRTVQAREVKTTTESKLIGPEMVARCSACLEDVSIENALTLQCKPEAHTYCRDCLVDLFASSLTNTTLFPPRCCKQPIPLDICRAMLPKELVKDFDLKVEELATPNPTYCANADCSKFIRSGQIRADVGTCVFCKSQTCVRCKNAEHDGLCPSDPHVQLLMDMAKRSKWQTCTKCKNLVELEVGCFHMSCRCTHQFCYLCGAAWVPRACTCPQWDEEYLTRPVNNAADAEAPAPPPQAPRVHVWQRQYGAQCSNCHATYLPWIMRCDGCNVGNCLRCIRNL